MAEEASFCSLAPLEGSSALPFHIGLLQSTAQESRALGAHVLARATSPCPSCQLPLITGWPAALLLHVHTKPTGTISCQGWQ